MIFDRKTRMLLDGTHSTGADVRERRKHEFDQGDGDTGDASAGRGSGDRRKRLGAGGKAPGEGLQSTRAGNLRVQEDRSEGRKFFITNAGFATTNSCRGSRSSKASIRSPTCYRARASMTTP